MNINLGNIFYHEIVYKLDLIGVIIGFVVGAFVILKFSSQRDIGLAIILGSFIYILVRGKLQVFPEPDLMKRQKTTLKIIFFILLTVSYWLYFNQQLYQRPILYFLIISILGGIISIQIICSNRIENKSLILIELLLFSFSIRYGIFYEYPSLSGADAYWHASFIQTILDKGFIPTYDEIKTPYSLYAIYHLIVIITQQLTKLNIKDSIFTSIGFIALISPTFIYLATKKLLDPPIGLMALLLIYTSDDLLVEGVVNFFPGTLVTSLFMLIIFLIFAHFDARFQFILILIVIIIILTHQLNTFVIWLTLSFFSLGIIIGSYIFKFERINIQNKINKKIYHMPLLLYLVFMIFYWTLSFSSNINSSFLQKITSQIYYRLTNSDIGLVSVGGKFGFLSNILFHLSYLIILVFIIGGILYWIASRNLIKFSLAFSIIMIFMLIYAIPSAGMDVALTGRWIAVIFPISSIIAASYILSVMHLLGPKRSKIAIFLILSTLTFFAITTPYVNNDHPIYGEDRLHKDQFSSSEISGIAFLNKVFTGTIITDESYGSGIFRQYQFNSTIKYFNLDFINNKNDNANMGYLTIIRKSMFNEIIRIYDKKSGFMPMRINEHTFLNKFKFYSLTYNNGGVIFYI